MNRRQLYQGFVCICQLFKAKYKGLNFIFEVSLTDLLLNHKNVSPMQKCLFLFFFFLSSQFSTNINTEY